MHSFINLMIKMDNSYKKHNFYSIFILRIKYVDILTPPYFEGKTQTCFDVFHLPNCTTLKLKKCALRAKKKDSYNTLRTLHGDVWSQETLWQTERPSQLIVTVTVLFHEVLFVTKWLDLTKIAVMKFQINRKNLQTILNQM